MLKSYIPNQNKASSKSFFFHYGEKDIPINLFPLYYKEQLYILVHIQ